MSVTTVARYRDAGGLRHQVVVRQTPDGHWQVLDISRRVKVVDTLTGCDDGRPQAEALARVYASDQHRLTGEDDSATRLAA